MITPPKIPVGRRVAVRTTSKAIISMEEDSDTRISFPSPFKQDVANGSEGTPKTDTMSFRKCLDMETNAAFLQNGKFLLLF